jgi:hypothetical protein
MNMASIELMEGSFVSRFQDHNSLNSDMSRGGVWESLPVRLAFIFISRYRNLSSLHWKMDQGSFAWVRSTVSRLQNLDLNSDTCDGEELLLEFMNLVRRTLISGFLMLRMWYMNLPLHV